MAAKFLLRLGESNQTFGTITFSGEFVFELGEAVDPGVWNKIGFIALDDGQQSITSSDLFEHLNSRLPIALRNKDNKEKLAYIRESKLRVGTDSFYLEEIL